MRGLKMKIGVLGAGGWGSALADLLSENSNEIVLWSLEANVVDEINTNKTNNTYLPGKVFSNKLKASNDSSDLKDCELLVNAIPSQYIRESISKYNLPLKDKYIVNGSKGIERKTLMRISEIFIDVADISPDKYAILSGPSHAEEVAAKMPTTVVSASENSVFCKNIQNVFSNQRFRVYSSEDVIGCEIGGSLKNVIAIAAGIIDGLGLGDNTKAALITRGLAEISRMGISLGANALTFSGLSGLGDLIVTCNSRHSRNRSVGEQIGKGRKLSDIISEMKMVAEGVNTTESAFQLGELHKVEMPITTQMYKILFEDLSPMLAIQQLMTRTSKREWWW